MKKENVIAKNETTVYYLKTFEDGSRAVLYDNGTSEGIWCAVDRLRYHLLHLANLRYGKNWETMIPADWEVIDEKFFIENCIY